MHRYLTTMQNCIEYTIRSLKSQQKNVIMNMIWNVSLDLLVKLKFKYNIKK